MIVLLVLLVTLRIIYCFTANVVEEVIESLRPEWICSLSLGNYSPSFQGCQQGSSNNISNTCVTQLLSIFGQVGSWSEIVSLCYCDLFVGFHYQKLIFLTCFYLTSQQLPIHIYNLPQRQKQQYTRLKSSSPACKKLHNFYLIQLSLIIRQKNIKIMTEHDKLLNRRLINQESHNRNLDHTIKSLQDEIQLTIYNYENILQTEKKNSSERSDFLLYLIQSLRTRHLEELQAMTVQIQNAQAQRESVQSMQKQMENIGDGLDQIMEESHKLKAQNESLTKQLEEEENKQKQLDEELDICHRQLQDCRLKVDDWERMKIKWNRHKKELIEMIEDAQKAAAEGQLQSEENQEYQKIICAHSGLDQNICDHCQKHRIEELRQKYSNEFRKST